MDRMEVLRVLMLALWSMCAMGNRYSFSIDREVIRQEPDAFLESNPEARVMTLKGRKYGCQQEQSVEAESKPVIKDDLNATIDELLSPLNQTQNNGCLQEDQ